MTREGWGPFRYSDVFKRGQYPWHRPVVLKLATPRQGHSRAVGRDRWATSLGYRLCVKPKYAGAPATRTNSQLAQNGMPKPSISTDHPKMIRSRCIIATT